MRISGWYTYFMKMCSLKCVWIHIHICIYVCVLLLFLSRTKSLLLCLCAHCCWSPWVRQTITKSVRGDATKSKNRAKRHVKANHRDARSVARMTEKAALQAAERESLKQRPVLPNNIQMVWCRYLVYRFSYWCWIASINHIRLTSILSKKEGT